MPAVASIALLNGEGTPVSHTFAPLGQNRETGFWWFEDQSPRIASTSMMGWPRIGIRSRRANDGGPGDSAKSRINRVEFILALPSLETLGTSDSGLTPPPTIAYVDRVKKEFLLPARDALADRKDLLAYDKNICSNAIFLDMIHNLTQLYG
jgi:hypothetical protein